MAISKESTWESAKKTLRFPSLKKNVQSELVIIGGGMVGILSAYLLLKEGRKPVIVEKNDLLSGATLLTTAFLTQVIDTSVNELVDMFGAAKTRRIWESHGQAIDLIERIVKQEKINCEFDRCS